MLFTRPGQLTRRYFAGQRVRFVSPLALFPFWVFAMVATLATFDVGQAGRANRRCTLFCGLLAEIFD